MSRFQVITLDQLELPKAMVDACFAANIENIDHLFRIPAHELQKKTGLNDEALETVLLHAHQILNPYKLDLSTWTRKRLSLGCEKLDSIFQGGLQTRQLTEFYGEAGCGKTQIALQLCLTVQLPEEEGGLNGDAMYLTSEPPFPTNRFFDLMSTRFPNLISPADVEEQQALMDEQGIDYRVKDAGSRVHIMSLTDLDQQLAFINHQLEEWLNMEEYRNVKLIILDSVAANFRGELHDSHKGGNHLGVFAARGRQLYELGRSLKHIAEEFDCVVVCMNQVTDKIDEGQKVATLGGSWSHTVNTRVRLTKTRLDDIPDVGYTGREWIRRMAIDFSPHLPTTSICYDITNNGLDGYEK